MKIFFYRKNLKMIRRKSALQLVRSPLQRKLKKDPMTNLEVSKVKAILKKNTHQKNPNQLRHANFLLRRRRVPNPIPMRTGARRRERKEVAAMVAKRKWLLSDYGAVKRTYRSSWSRYHGES